jgi:hypothetical protein
LHARKGEREKCEEREGERESSVDEEWVKCWKNLNFKKYKWVPMFVGLRVGSM